MVKKPGLLFVSYYFPPTKSIACIRNYNICAEFNLRYDVHVLTTNNTSRFTHDQYPHLDIVSKVHLWTIDIRTLINRKPLKSTIKKGNTSSFIYSLLNSFPYNILLGIGGLIYILHGLIVGLRSIKKNRITTLYSSYFPYSDHIICYLLKRIKPQLTWIADFRDLHYEATAENIVHPKLQKLFNKKILSKADLVTTVSNGLLYHLKPFNENSIVVRNAFGQLNTKILDQVKKIYPKKLTISYTGNLIPGKRDPSMLFQVIQKLKQQRVLTKHNFNLQYVGGYKQYWEKLALDYDLVQFCSIKGVVPLEESYALQKNSTINLLLSSSSQQATGILTGKFYEYLAAGNSIILILTGEQKDSEFDRIFEDLSCGKIFYYHDKESASELSLFIQDSMLLWEKTGKLSSSFNNDSLQKYTTRSQVDQIFRFLELE